jgi:hypothetical protein
MFVVFCLCSFLPYFDSELYPRGNTVASSGKVLSPPVDKTGLSIEDSNNQGKKVKSEKRKNKV